MADPVVLELDFMLSYYASFDVRTLCYFGRFFLGSNKVMQIA